MKIVQNNHVIAYHTYLTVSVFRHTTILSIWTNQIQSIPQRKHIILITKFKPFSCVKKKMSRLKTQFPNIKTIAVSTVH
jgi:hypothetical protein